MPGSGGWQLFGSLENSMPCLQMDVKDCYEALQEVVVAGLIDPARVVVQGGSHGGMVFSHRLWNIIHIHKSLALSVELIHRENAPSPGIHH